MKGKRKRYYGYWTWEKKNKTRIERGESKEENKALLKKERKKKMDKRNKERDNERRESKSRK